MEKKVNNAFTGRTDGYVDNGCDYSNDLVEVFALVDAAKSIGDDETDVLIYKVPKCIDSYHLSEKVQAATEGQDLKSILKRCAMTGDISILNQREAIYGDCTQLPRDMRSAMQQGVENEALLDKLSDSDLDTLAAVKNMSKTELDNYIKSIVDAQIKAKQGEGGSENE